MKKSLNTKNKPALTAVYALVAVVFIMAFQLYWLYSVYQNQRQLVQEQAKNILREYVLDYDSMLLVQKMRGSESLVPEGLANELLKAGKGKVDVQVKLVGESNNPLVDSLVKKVIDSIMAPENADILDRKLMDNLKSNLGYAFPKLKYGFTYVRKGVKISYPKVLPAANGEVIEIASQLNPSQNYKLKLFNLNGVILYEMRWYLVLSVIYLAVCISAVFMLLNSSKRSRKLMEMKDNFTNNMTHELKTPLATLYAATEALDTYNMIDDKVAAREYIHIMQADLKRLTGMTESILYNAKLSDGKIYLKKESVNLRELLADVVTKFKPSTNAVNAVINIEGVPESVYLFADAEHLLNVFSNLVDNSLKYSRGGAVIEFNAVEEKEAVIITVTDNGIGIAENYYKDIFKPYFRVSEGDKHTVKGYGLGLSYAREIISLHNGTLKLLKSELDKGTTFQITLPVNNG
jgi:signal transduction histidine kinase